MTGCVLKRNVRRRDNVLATTCLQQRACNNVLGTIWRHNRLLIAAGNWGISYSPIAVAAITGHVENRYEVYYIPGTRISLDSIGYAFRQRASPESIREDCDGLSLPHAYGAIAFYLDHQTGVDAYLAARKEQWRELAREGTPPNADLPARLESARRQAIPSSR
jgi:hypothetical protein